MKLLLLLVIIVIAFVFGWSIKGLLFNGPPPNPRGTILLYEEDNLILEWVMWDHSNVCYFPGSAYKIVFEPNKEKVK